MRAILYFRDGSSQQLEVPWPPVPELKIPIPYEPICWYGEEADLSNTSAVRFKSLLRDRVCLMDELVIYLEQ